MVGICYGGSRKVTQHFQWDHLGGQCGEREGPRAELWDPPMFKCWEMRRKWPVGMASQKPSEESMSGRRQGPAAPTIVSRQRRGRGMTLDSVWWDQAQLARTCMAEQCRVQK